MVRNLLKGLGLAAIATVMGGMSVSEAAPVAHACAAPIRSMVKTDTGGLKTSATNFVNVPGAAATVTVPAGKSYCVKVRFSVQMRCFGSAGNDECFIRVVSGGGVVFDPSIEVSFSTTQSVGVRSFEWVKELGPGSHAVRVQAVVQDAATQFDLQMWTLNVEVTN
jgi:hypothetical protein